VRDNAEGLVSATDWIRDEDLAAVAAACGDERASARYLRQLLLAIPYQLAALLDNGYVERAVVGLVLDIQRRRAVLIDPDTNWFIRNLQRFGQGFNLGALARDPALMAEKFNRLARHWEEYVTGGQYREVFSWVARSVRTLAPALVSTGRFLDLACGVGLIGQTLRLTGIEGHLTGIDLSPGMLAKARARGCYDALIEANVNEPLPLADECADVVICTGALELLDVDAVLRECHRVVRAGGALWASFQHDDGTSPNPTAHQNVVGLTEGEIVRRLEKWHFRISATENCRDAFVTPSESGILQPVPYLFVRAEHHS
jgi:predicted TPR repeat methyltransferase